MFSVLLVDDEPSIRLTMAEFLKRAGYSVISAADFESASNLEGVGIDVAVVDINLPGRSGIELLQEINRREPYVPVIMITGEPNLSDTPEIVRAGAYDFIVKPVVKDALLKAVGRAAENKRLIDDRHHLQQQIKQHAEELELRVAERTAELVEAHERLARQEKIAALGRVAAQVAHEVRNPLAGLLLYSLHLKDQVANKLSDGEIQLIDNIIDTINQLTNTTEQILNFARPMKLTPRRIEVNRVINDVLQLLKAQTSANEIELNLSLSSSNPIGMLDEASIRAALLNIMLNAIQAMSNGGQLSLSSSNTGEVVSLLISDTGCGMTEEQVERVFEPFNTTKRHGLGLGMPYAQKIIQQHSGTIKVDSRIGEGTNITIELPVGEEQK